MPPFTIGMIRVALVDSPGMPGETTADNYKPQKYREEQYMAIETGIGSGSVYSVEDLFPTLEEAQVECDKRNENQNESND
jgi:hypothetical protein